MSAHDGQVRRASNDAYGYGKATAKTDASRAFGTNLTNRITQAAAASVRKCEFCPGPFLTLTNVFVQKPVAKVSQQNTTHDIPVSLPVLAPVQQAQAPEVVAPMLTRALLDDVEIPEVDIESNRDRRDPAQVHTIIVDLEWLTMGLKAFASSVYMLGLYQDIGNTRHYPVTNACKLSFSSVSCKTPTKKQRRSLVWSHRYSS